MFRSEIVGLGEARGTLIPALSRRERELKTKGDRTATPLFSFDPSILRHGSTGSPTELRTPQAQGPVKAAFASLPNPLSLWERVRVRVRPAPRIPKGITYLKIPAGRHSHESGNPEDGYRLPQACPPRRPGASTRHPGESRGLGERCPLDSGFRRNDERSRNDEGGRTGAGGRKGMTRKNRLRDRLVYNSHSKRRLPVSCSARNAFADVGRSLLPTGH